MLLTAGVASESARTALRLARAARAKGHDVELFLMDDGVYAVKPGKRTPVADDLASLIDERRDRRAVRAQRRAARRHGE